MSKKDKQRHLRQLRCEGCPRHCRYADFRAYGLYAGGFAPPQKRDGKAKWKREKELKTAREAGKPLPHGNTGRRHDGQLLFGEASAATKKESPDSAEWVYRSKGKVLGTMHAEKMQLWEEFTTNCPFWGTDGEDQEE